MLKLRHTGIYVHDLECMKNFYCENFGMQIAVHAFEKGDYIDTVLGLRGTELELYKLKFCDGSMLELIHRKGEDKKEARGMVYDAGCCHIAITIENIEYLYEKLSDNGVKFISRPIFSEDGKAKVSFCKDPEGNYLELVEEIGKNEKLCRNNI